MLNIISVDKGRISEQTLDLPKIAQNWSLLNNTLFDIKLNGKYKKDFLSSLIVFTLFVFSSIFQDEPNRLTLATSTGLCSRILLVKPPPSSRFSCPACICADLSSAQPHITSFFCASSYFPNITPFASSNYYPASTQCLHFLYIWPSHRTQQPNLMSQNEISKFYSCLWSPCLHFAFIFCTVHWSF